MRTNARALRSWKRASLAVAVLGLLAAAPAQAQLINEQVGAALAMPLVGGEKTRTYLTVTNVGPEDRILHFNVIDGKDWDVTDFDCAVTASETLLIHWEALGGGFQQLRMECNQAGRRPGQMASRVFGWSEGILFVTVEDEIGGRRMTETRNDLLGDFTIVDASAGFAVGASAIPFQGRNPLAPGVTDRDYHFDNVEYSMFPSTLASNFIAPGDNQTLGQGVTADLILFTLDGRANIGSHAALDVVFFDDDETPTSAHYDFDCFSIVGLTDIDPNFEAGLLGSDSGHFYMTAIDADQSSNVHDNKYGNGNGIRVVGVHGWLLQSIGGIISVPMDADLEGAAPEATPSEVVSPATREHWLRSLAQGMLPQSLDGSDVPTFDGL